MELKGCIDNFNNSVNYLIISGWMYLLDDGKRILPKKEMFYIVNSNIVKEIIDIEISQRPDISKDESFGFIIKIYGKSFNNIVNEDVKIRIKYDQWEFYLPVWDKLKDKVIKMPELKENKDKYTKFFVEVGTISIDKNSVIGSSADIYLVKGTNEILSLYDDSYQSRAKEWISLIESRNKKSIENKCKFLQTFIPEKLSIEQNNFPYKIKSNITKNLKEVNEYFTTKGSPFYLDLCDTLRELNMTYPAFRKADIHLSFLGTKIVFESIIKKLELPLIKVQPEIVLTLKQGGFVKEFFNGLIYEELYFPNLNTWPFAKQPIELIKIKDGPTPNAHIGIERVWRCKEPLSDKKIVIIGVSNCERGNSPLNLSWWFSRYFRETHFIWHFDFQDEYIKTINPDIVFCETTERFMHRIPSS